MIKNTTKVDKELMLKVTYASKPIKRMFVLYYILIGIAAGLGILFLVIKETRMYGIILMVLAAILVLFVFLFRINLKKQVDSNKTLDDNSFYYFTVTETGMSYNFESSTISTAGEFSWNIVHRLLETATHFHIYISKQELFLIDKTGFTEGTAEDFRALLTEKAGAGFKPYKPGK